MLACKCYSSVAAEVRHHLVACRPAASNRRTMLCRTTSHNSSVGLSQQGPATVLRSPSADLAQRSQCSSSTRGTKDAISPTARRQASARADVRICVSPSPHSSRESRWCTVVEISVSGERARLAPFGVWGFSLVWRSIEPPQFVAGGWTTDSHKKRGPFASCMRCWGSSRTEAFNFSLNSCLACA